MTESLSFLAAAWALYAIMLALERPTVLRQLARPRRDRRRVPHATPVRHPLRDVGRRARGPLADRAGDEAADAGGPLRLLADGAAARRSACSRSSRSSPRAALAADSLGAYWELWRGYDPLEVGKWFVYHLGDFAVYLAVVPVAVAPIVLWAARRAPGRAGSRPAAAFVALFAAANVSGLLVVAAFTSTPYGYDRLHDRYGFYLLPLWLVGLVVWLAAGLPRPLVATAIGVVAALALPLILPFGQLANEAGIDTVPGALWVRIEAELGGARAGVGPPRPRRLRRRAPRCDVPPAAAGRPDRAARGRGRLVRRHVVLRVGAHDRRAGGRRLRGRPRARLDRRSAAATTPRSTKLYLGHAPAAPRSSGTRCS